MLSQRNIKATWNDKLFTSNNQDAVWIPKSDGTREIVFNPNVTEDKFDEESFNLNFKRLKRILCAL